MWLTIIEGMTAVYLISGSMILEANNIQSKVYFKVIPMGFGIALAFGVVAKVAGWPI
jgi:hypothetical protein